jgi:hypothetical protein
VIHDGGAFTPETPPAKLTPPVREPSIPRDRAFAEPPKISLTFPPETETAEIDTTAIKPISAPTSTRPAPLRRLKIRLADSDC